MPGMQSTQWVFTWFPPTYEVDGEQYPCEEPQMHEDFRGIIYGWEWCPETGRGHWQGHVMFKTRKGARGLAQKYGFSYMARCKDVEESVDYCKKDGMWTMHGEIVSQGHRADLDSASLRLQAGEDVGDVINGDIELYTKYGRGFHFVFQHAFKKRVKELDVEGPCTIYWFWGPSGGGKSRAAREACEALKASGIDYYDHVPDNNDWWDSYNGQTVILMDEFSGADFKYKKLLRLTDRYTGRRVPKRNCEMLPFVGKIFYFTSVLTPEQCYSGQAENAGGISQLLRRITEIKRFGPPEPVPGGEELEAWLNAPIREPRIVWQGEIPAPPVLRRQIADGVIDLSED